MAHNPYYRSKEDYLELINAVMERVGDTLILEAFLLNQQLDNGKILSTYLRTDECHLLLQRLPRDYNSPEGIQRAYKTAKLTEIAEEADKPNYTAPGSIVGTLEPKTKTWIDVKFKDDRHAQMTVNLAKMKACLESLEESNEGIDEANFKVGYMIDAHHRTEGHYRAGKMELEMAAVFYIDLPRREDMARIFAAVNQKQEKPSQVHTLAMRDMAGLLEGNEEAAVEIIKGMEEDNQSILYRRIKTVDGRRPLGFPKAYVSISALSKFLKDDVIGGISSKKLDDRRNAIEGYFRAWKEVFPEAWKDENKHVLVKSMGFAIMCNVFKEVNSITQTTSGKALPKSDDYKKTISHLEDMRIALKTGDQTQEFPLDWSSETFGGLSSGKGINAIITKIEEFLTQNKAKIAGLEQVAV